MKIIWSHWNESTVRSCWQFTCFSIAWSVNGPIILNKWPKNALAFIWCKSLGNSMIFKCIQHCHVQHYLYFIKNIYLFINWRQKPFRYYLCHKSWDDKKTVIVFTLKRKKKKKKPFVRKDLDLKMNSKCLTIIFSISTLDCLF